jgi:hypothetical protein
MFDLIFVSAALVFMAASYLRCRRTAIAAMVIAAMAGLGVPALQPWIGM